jgi:hypothetical protein
MRRLLKAVLQERNHFRRKEASTVYTCTTLKLPHAAKPNRAVNSSLNSQSLS